MTTTQEHITLDELAVAMGNRPADVERECAELDVPIVTDWANRRAVTVQDARELVNGTRRNVVEHEKAWAQHQADNERWRQGRTDFARKAAQREREREQSSFGRALAVLTGGADRSSPGAIEGAAHDAAEAALIEYERKVPRPIWQATGKPTAVLEFYRPAGVH